MKYLLKDIKENMQKPGYRRYDAVHQARGGFMCRVDTGDGKLYSAAEVLELLELVAMDPEKEVK